MTITATTTTTTRVLLASVAHFYRRKESVVWPDIVLIPSLGQAHVHQPPDLAEPQIFYLNSALVPGLPKFVMEMICRKLRV